MFLYCPLVLKQEDLTYIKAIFCVFNKFKEAMKVKEI